MSIKKAAFGSGILFTGMLGIAMLCEAYLDRGLYDFAFTTNDEVKFETSVDASYKSKKSLFAKWERQLKKKKQVVAAADPFRGLKKDNRVVESNNIRGLQLEDTQSYTAFRFYQPGVNGQAAKPVSILNGEAGLTGTLSFSGDKFFLSGISFPSRVKGQPNIEIPDVEASIADAGFFNFGGDDAESEGRGSIRFEGQGKYTIAIASARFGDYRVAGLTFHFFSDDQVSVARNAMEELQLRDRITVAENTTFAQDLSQEEELEDKFREPAEEDVDIDFEDEEQLEEEDAEVEREERVERARFTF